MLDGTQEIVGLPQLVARSAVDPAFLGERRQHCDGAAAAQVRPSPAEDELLGLDEELDLADAAAPELDVVPGHRDRVVTAHGMDLALHRMDIGDGGEVEILAPDEGPQARQEVFARLNVAGDRARLDIGGALPVLAEILVVEIGGVQRDGRRCRSGIGAQAIIDAMDVTLGGALLQQLGDPLREFGEERRRSQAFLQPRDIGIEEHDEVDIAGIIELAGPELAEAEDDEAGFELRARDVMGVKPPGLGRLQQKSFGRCMNGGIGEIGERLGHRRQGPEAADIGEGHEKGMIATVASKLGGDGIEIADLSGVTACGGTLPGDEVGHHAFGRSLQHRGDAPGIPHHTLPEKGRMVGKAEK